MTDRQYECERKLRCVAITSNHEIYARIFTYCNAIYPNRKSQTIEFYDANNEKFISYYYNLTCMEYSEVVATNILDYVEGWFTN